jgi:hypothetical protein
MAPEYRKSSDVILERMMELQSRKEVIERWLTTDGIPFQLLGALQDLQEMLATVESELTELQDRHSVPRNVVENLDPCGIKACDCAPNPKPVAAKMARHSHPAKTP